MKVGAAVVAVLVGGASGFVAPRAILPALSTQRTREGLAPRMGVDLETKPSKESQEADKSAVETTEKYGLEAGLFKVLKSGGEGKGAQAKDLLKRYGSAYLITSISLAALSFTACYFAVDSGVDVAALLSKVGIDATGATEKAGTVAIAYAAHKAASPVRFPPTVALTPLVAKWLGREDREPTE